MKQQHGATMAGFLGVAFLLVLAILLALKLSPAYLENYSLKSVMNDMANDPELVNASPIEIRNSFTKRAEVGDIKSVTAEDLSVKKDNGKIEISANYGVKVPLVGNLSAWIEFDTKVEKDAK